MEQKVETSVILFQVGKYRIEQLNRRNVIIRDVELTTDRGIIGYYPKLYIALHDLLDIVSRDNKLDDPVKSLIQCIQDAKDDIVEAVNNLDLDALTAS